MYVQGAYVLMHVLPYGLATHNYGPDAMAFKPQRWMSSSSSSTGNLATACSTTASTPTPSGDEALQGATGKAGCLPELTTFLTGPRDW